MRLLSLTSEAHRRRAALCVVAALLSLVSATCIAHRYTDLRRIDPIQGNATVGARKATTCLACHGADGTSAAPTFPRLAGQRADFLYHRLVSFKRASPKDPYYATSPMAPLAAPLSDEDMRDLASFFASLTPAVSDVAAAPAAVQQGETLFLSGDTSRGTPPCQGCHGADASGASERTGPYAAYPALRGQYAPYVTARLTNFRNGLPHNTTSDMIMGGVAYTLDDSSIQAIAAWLASLPPVKSL